jgi:subtilisin family serine protease
MRRLIVLAAVLSLLLSVGPVNAVAPVQAGRGSSTDARAANRYIVLFRDGADADREIGRLSRGLDIRPDHAYNSAVQGFSARLNAHQLAVVQADPSVALVEVDRVVQLEAQTLPTGVDRVDADLSSTAKIDGLDERVDADIAIIDTGIQADHPDLNVAGGHNCINADPADWVDGNGHGTHVAGIAAAKDNEIGVVGVAPGARLWAVRVFDSSGFSLLSWIVCGIDWVTSQKDPIDSTKPLFEAANMSLRDAGSNDGNCGFTNGDSEHQAICASVAAGTTYAVAAGNDRTDAGQWIPAAYPEVITVSALADFNGQPGGGAPSTCSSFSSADSDDTFADFSNFGPAVDLIAPGKCIYSTYSTLKSTRTGYAVLSGTSMATPHVAGAIALYRVGHPTATPSEVQTALQAAGTLDWFTNTDPDATHERLLNVSSFGATPDFSISASPSSVSLPDGGGIANYAITVVRGNGFSGSIEFGVTGLPGGATASFSPNPVGDPGLTSALSVTVPGAVASGTYGLTIIGASGTLTRTASVSLVKQAAATAPSAPTNVAATAGNTQATVSFSAPASDGGSPITSYTVTSTPGNLTATGASSPITVTGLTNGTPYTFTVHATNAAGPGPESSASNSVTPTAPLTITTTTLPAGRVNRSYSATVQVTGGTLPYTWKIASGALPPGLTLGASTGTISGTPTKPGSYSFTIAVADGATQTATRAFSIKITRK